MSAFGGKATCRLRLIHVDLVLNRSLGTREPFTGCMSLLLSTGEVPWQSSLWLKTKSRSVSWHAPDRHASPVSNDAGTPSVTTTELTKQFSRGPSPHGRLCFGPRGPGSLF